MRRRVAIVLSVLLLPEAALTPAGAQAPDTIVYSTYLSDQPRPRGAIFTVDPDGQHRTRLTKAGGHSHSPTWSPDRTAIAFERYSWRRNLDVWVMDADGSDKRRLTLGRNEDALPRWSPDGGRIAWLRRRKGADVARLFVMNADGTGKTLVADRVDAQNPASWSPDGSRIAYVWRKGCVECEDADVDIRVIDADGTDETVLAGRPRGEYEPVWSPDGSKIAFTRATAEGYAVFEITADGSHERLVASFDGTPLFKTWSPDGMLLALTLIVAIDPFEPRLDERLVLVDAATGDKRMLTDVDTGGWGPEWAPDGSRIAFLGFHDGSREILLTDPEGDDLRPLATLPGDEAYLDW